MIQTSDLILSLSLIRSSDLNKTFTFKNLSTKWVTYIIINYRTSQHNTVLTFRIESKKPVVLRPSPDQTNPGTFVEMSKHEHNANMNGVSITAKIASKFVI